MKKILCLLTFTIWFISVENCTAGEVLVQSRWTDSTIVVDGNPEDWGKFPMTHFEKGNVSLGAVNDSEYLYLMLSFRDQASARFLQSKVTLWLDKTASKEKLLGFCYTGSPPPIRKEQEFQDSEDNLTQRPVEMPKIVTILENKDTLGMIPTYSEKGPAIITSYQQGFYFHEIRVPLKRNDSTRFAIGAPLDATLSLGLELGGGPGGRPGDGKQLPGKQEFWLKVSLAQSSQPAAEKSKENK